MNILLANNLAALRLKRRAPAGLQNTEIYLRIGVKGNAVTVDITSSVSVPPVSLNVSLLFLFVEALCQRLAYAAMILQSLPSKHYSVYRNVILVK